MSQTHGRSQLRGYTPVNHRLTALASADMSIILHSFDLGTGRSTVLQKYSGHTQPVRGLALRPDGKGFWSCGNDR